ncbi:DNA/RNA helicase domain-containing protein [Lactococcus sp.]|uniref:DNA/RNA helicase domain-containing protein n=1 Tax=Lactococcus sp. TaxID=44273 RepID=UPI0035B2A65C
MQIKKPSNLHAFIDSYKITQPLISTMYLKMKDYNAKPQELEAIQNIIDELSLNGLDTGDLSHFFINYQIPQISKEFDLLRFGENYNINIELKLNKSEEDIHKQLLQNDYYLSALDKPTYYFSYESVSGKLYFLNNVMELEKVTFSTLAEYLTNQEIGHIENIDKLFAPSKYLISPFSLDDRFITENYFLNGTQDEIKRAILSGKNKFIKVTGKPGTGKSLLIYDVAKTLMEKGKQVSIIHAGKLNSGHRNLNNNYSWHIFPATDLKSEKNCLKRDPDYIIIDEAQRLYLNQFKEIEDFISSSDKDITLIVSYDIEQVLSNRESSSCLASILEAKGEMTNYQTLRLSKRIRSNPDLSKFIQGLFDLKKMVNVKSTEQIAFQYFSKYSDAKSFAKKLEEKDWKVIDYTVPNYEGKDIAEMAVDPYFGVNAHEVIGQEFEKVVVVIGKEFFYDENRKLGYKNNRYYAPEKMLYQMVTRARSGLMLIIVNNEPLLGEIISSIKID